MTEDRLADDLARSIHRRTRHVDAQPDVDALLERATRHTQRRRRVWVAALVGALVVGAGFGYLWADSGDGSSPQPQRIAPLDDGTPSVHGSVPDYEPTDVASATAAIRAAFALGLAGQASSTKYGAIQDGSRVAPLFAESSRRAALVGYTPEQIAGATVTTGNVSFIDPTHAIVQFTLTVPGHGDVLRDRVGYAVLQDGSWKVSLRTACDLLSLGGLGLPCPPGN